MKIVHAYGGKIVLERLDGRWFYSAHRSRKYDPPRQLADSLFSYGMSVSGYGYGETLAKARRHAVNCLKEIR